MTSLEGRWEFHAGDLAAGPVPSWPDEDWLEIDLPSGFTRRDAESEIVWYRKTMVFEGFHQWHRGLRLGVTLGKGNSAYEVYAGGLLLGGVGSLPPEPSIDYDRHVTFAIPSYAIDPSGRLTLAVKVWKSPQTRGTIGTLYEGPFFIGPLEELTRRELMSELDLLFLSVFFFLVGAFHLELYRRHTALESYLWFALVSWLFAIYGLLRSQWKYQLFGEHFLVFKEVEHLSIYLNAACFAQLLWLLLGAPIPRWLRVCQGANVFCGLLVALTPGLTLNTWLLPFWQLGVLVLIVVGSYEIIVALLARRPEMDVIAAGTLAAGLTFVFDLGIDRGVWHGPRLSLMGFGVFLLGLAACLAQRFLRTHRDLEALKLDLEKRVDERTHQLVEASQAKSRFLATMSHEIRTPLNGILGMTQLLLTTPLESEQAEYVQVVRKSGDVLLASIDDILDFSGIEVGNIELQEEPFGLRECVEEVLDMMAPRAAEKELDLVYRAAPELADQWIGDRMRLRQVLVHLVGNAIKFTDQGWVRVFLEMAPAQAEGSSTGHRRLLIRVCDSGLGIAADHQAILFEGFRQLDGSLSRRHEGTGLGLAISRHLVSLMDGEITVRSKEGEGSEFRVDIRLRTVAGKRDLKDVTRPVARLVGKHALLRLDSEVTRQVVEELLDGWGMAQRAAADSAEALSWIEQGESFDVALIELSAGGDGGVLARELHQMSTPTRRVLLRRGRLVEPFLPPVDPRDSARLSLPLKPRELRQALIAVSRNVPLAEDGAEALADPRMLMAELAPLEILLVEDREVDQIVIARMLGNLGYAVDIVADREPAMHRLQRRSYDIVMVSLEISRRQGDEILGLLAQLFPDGDAPWSIVLTTELLTTPQDKAAWASELGVDDCLGKPLQMAELVSALRLGSAAIPRVATDR